MEGGAGKQIETAGKLRACVRVRVTLCVYVAAAVDQRLAYGDAATLRRAMKSGLLQEGEGREGGEGGEGEQGAAAHARESSGTLAHWHTPW